MTATYPKCLHRLLTSYVGQPSYQWTSTRPAPSTPRADVPARSTVSIDVTGVEDTPGARSEAKTSRVVSEEPEF